MKIDISDIPGIEFDPNRAGGKAVICGSRITADVINELIDAAFPQWESDSEIDDGSWRLISGNAKGSANVSNF